MLHWMTVIVLQQGLRRRVRPSQVVRRHAREANFSERPIERSLSTCYCYCFLMDAIFDSG